MTTQVANKKSDLVGDDRLVLWSVVHVEVVDTRVDAQFTARRAACGVDRRSWLGDLVVRLEEVGLSSAVTEAAVIEDESSNACGRKALSERPQSSVPSLSRRCAPTRWE